MYGAKGTLVRACPEIARKSCATQLDAFYDAIVEHEKDLKRRAVELESAFGSRPRVVVREGDATTIVAREAEQGGQAALVTVCSRRLGPVSRVRLGSVSTKAVRAAQGPVLVPPPPASMCQNPYPTCGVSKAWSPRPEGRSSLVEGQGHLADPCVERVA